MFNERSGKKRRVVKEKFETERSEKINQNPLKGLNAKQQDYINKINSFPLVIATGYAGTSKTYIPTVMACDMYRLGHIERIVFTRPNISNSKSLGMFKGDVIEKISQWLMPVINILREKLGQATLEIAIKNGDIQFVPLEVIKGYSATDCMFICDEAEDLTADEAKKIVTRQGKNCKMVLCGDITQSELKEGSGLKRLFEMCERHKTLNVGLVDFNNINDIVRSQACKDWVIAFNKDEKEGVYDKK